MAVFWYTLLFSCVALVYVLPETVGADKSQREREADKVVYLPGQPLEQFGFQHFAGYIKLRPNDEKALFYWFFEAQNDVSHRPLVLWLNGGPGCSSVAYGAMQELGPFLVRNNGQLIYNKYSWNKVANILFLEAPVGVGFSYSNKSGDTEKLGDSITAEDSHAFLIGWFKRFPNFRLHDFYIAGESYAGHYVPQLANLIHEKNKGAKKGYSINLKGILMGNAVINDPTDQPGLIDYAWTHAIISDQLHRNIYKDCDFKSNISTSQCTMHIRGFLEAYSGIDIYNIYAPVCLSSLNKAAQKLIVAPRFFTQQDLWHKLPSGYDPCTEDYVEAYLNREDVQKALHANLTKLSYPYTPCSGDTDGRVPVTSTRYSINEMGLKVKEEWRAWYHKQQVAGWVETYVEGGLTFLTVRGAGHQVPMFAPDQSLSLFSHFLSSTPLPSSHH
ncbi:serine carboxypeptidase-like 35 isoform X2 [Coffea arabica]|uniref:Carboxypeptidase n=1 Tax=Coffea arabica TaxID=13443 RepID=A0ABM4W2I1_COFAR